MSEPEKVNLAWDMEIHCVDDCRDCFEAFDMECGDSPCQLGKKLIRQYFSDKSPDEWNAYEGPLDVRPGAE